MTNGTGVNQTELEECDDERPEADHFLRNIADYEIALIGVCAFLCVCNCFIVLDICIYVCRRHHHNLKRAVRSTIWMVGLTPTIAILALIGMMIPRAWIFIDFLMIIAISLIMYQFIHLIVAYFRCYDKIRKNLLGVKKFKYDVYPCCCCKWRPRTITVGTINVMKYLVLQYPVIAMITTSLMMITYLDGTYETGVWEGDNPYPYVTVIRIVSILTSIYGLIVLAEPAKDALAPLRIRAKFTSLRMTMILYSVQGLVFDIIEDASGLFDFRGCFAGPVMSNYYKNLFLSFEMFFFTLLNLYAYRREITSPEVMEKDINIPAPEEDTSAQNNDSGMKDMNDMESHMLDHMRGSVDLEPHVFERYQKELSVRRKEKTEKPAEANSHSVKVVIADDEKDSPNGFVNYGLEDSRGVAENEINERL